MPVADGAAAVPPERPEGEPHLTFQMLLADTLHEMAVHEDSPAAEPDEIDRLRDHTLSALRTDGGVPVTHPFHHPYLTGADPSAAPSAPSRLDVRY